MRLYLNMVTEGILGPYEGDGPLWHGTDLLGAASILLSDRLDKSIDTNNPAGASLTHSETTAWGFADRSSHIFDHNHYASIKQTYPEWSYGPPPKTGAILQFDVAKLRQSYRLIHYVDDDLFFEDDEEEVRVLGDRIAPLSRYLVSFSFHPKEAIWFAAYMRLPMVRQDWNNQNEMADFLERMHLHPLFKGVA